MSAPTVGAAIRMLEGLGIVRELTGKQRNRLFGYDRYIALLAEGTSRNGPARCRCVWQARKPRLRGALAYGRNRAARAPDLGGLQSLWAGVEAPSLRHESCSPDRRAFEQGGTMRVRVGGPQAMMLGILLGMGFGVVGSSVGSAVLKRRPAPAPTSLAERRWLPLEWNGYRKPVAYEHMYFSRELQR